MMLFPLGSSGLGETLTQTQDTIIQQRPLRDSGMIQLLWSVSEFTIMVGAGSRTASVRHYLLPARLIVDG